LRVEILRELEKIPNADGVIHEEKGILILYIAKKIGFKAS
jgi:hypothetical protein